MAIMTKMASYQLVLMVVIKNWEPFELGPVLTMETIPEVHKTVKSWIENVTIFLAQKMLTTACMLQQDSKLQSRCTGANSL